MKAVKFAYMDEFRCVGAECGDSCCKHWAITLSKREYSDFLETKCSPRLKSVIDSAFFPVRGGSELCFAAMKLKENGDCPFWDADRLCMLQKELGEAAMCHTCRIFPRLFCKVGNDMFIGLCSLNCSRTAELLIKHSEGLEIVEAEYDGSNEYINMGIFSGDSTPSSWEGLPYYRSIRRAQLGILQNRSFTLPERMLHLGYYSMKADKYVKRAPENLAALSEIMTEPELCKMISDSLKTSQSEESAADKTVAIISKMYDRSMHKNSISRFAEEQLQAVAERIDLRKKELSDEGGRKRIATGYSREKYFELLSRYRELEASRPYIIENVLVNTVFSQALHKGIWANFFSLAVFYNCLKICVPSFLNDGYTDRDLALAISRTSKLAVNTGLIRNGTLLDFLDNRAFDLPHAVFLIN